MSLAIINIGDSVAGGRDGAPINGDAIVCDLGTITWIGNTGDVDPAEHETVVDAAGSTVLPGLIDSHVHSTFGDYTPRQNTVGFLESYVHGGTTSVISASEVHVPGRPKDVEGVKALAVAANRCYRDYRPGGMRVHAGSIILEPGLTLEDFQEIAHLGVWLAKAGFGAFSSPSAYAPVIAAAKAAGIKVMFHTGGGSIPGSLNKITVDALLETRPQISGHCNGGPTALSAEENRRLVTEGHDIALQLVHAGNLRSAIHISELALEQDQFHRIMIATDTPTGTGVIPLGMLREMAELTSLGPLTPRQAVLAATGNVADVYDLNSGKIEVGRDADFVILDAPLGSDADDALGAFAIGDLPGISTVITDGVVRLTKSRNTPTPKRTAKLTHAGAPALTAELVH
ncbi:amidohydrolase family protein [Paenarthrobacter ureafaciens]|uniref:amidohydrolase family protein n=1 Tax=Paenarthrobacter ureafaciens TaxID=37931 RepID=UPI0014077131|nr:amidohydrolase family protein [Paenarthrobacter ureafaciens]MCX8453606.1 amidohydrolase family protein [Paenarthrobacter ureafaciens]MCY0973265.1 amidohydrolase family protein [Paenarthrobacter ureafaciens]